MINMQKRKDNHGIFSIHNLKRDWPLYCMLAWPVCLLIVFSYIPMFGIVIAFEKFLPSQGVFNSKWTGFANFTTLFKMPGFYQALINTLRMSIWKIVLGVIVPVTFSLLLNEIASNVVKRCVQTFIYLPHFISWVLMAGIFTKLLSSNGLVNRVIMALGGSPVLFLASNKWFRFTVIFTHIWKEFGYGTIVYLAAIAGVNVDLYEAAEIDGAGHFQQLLHVTLPSIVPIVILMSTLAMGNILNAGFDQIFNLYNPVVYESGDIIDTLVYRIGIGSGQFGLSSAAGLFKSAVSTVLILASYRIAFITSGYHVF